MMERLGASPEDRHESSGPPEAPPGLSSCYSHKFAVMDFGDDDEAELEEEPSHSEVPEILEQRESLSDSWAREDSHEEGHELPKVETQVFSMSPPPGQNTEKPTCASIGIQTDVHLSLDATRVTWTPSIDEFVITEKVVEGEDAKLNLAIIAQSRDVLPEAVVKEESSSDSDSDESEEEEEEEVEEEDYEAGSGLLSRSREEAAGVRSNTEASQLQGSLIREEAGEAEADIWQGPPGAAEISVAEHIQMFESLKQAAEDASVGSGEDSAHSTDEVGATEIRGGADERSVSLMSIEDDDMPLLPLDSDMGVKTERKEASSDAKKKKTGVKMRLKRGITMDTGAHHNVMHKRMAGKRMIRQSPGSRRGMHYVAAGNERIKNEGEIDFDFESIEGHKETFVFQIADVNKALGSVAYVVDKAFRVVYDKNMDTGEDLSYMIHKPSKKTFRFRRERNVWILDAMVGSESIFGDFSRPE